jgi:putative transposase
MKYEAILRHSPVFTVEKMCIHHQDYQDFEEVKQDVFSYIELFYNRRWMHSTLGYKTPVEYRLAYSERLAT